LRHMGAKVLHPRAAEITMEEGIPLQILSVYRNPIGGTTIKHGVQTTIGSGWRIRLQIKLLPALPYLGKRAQVRIKGPKKLFIAPVWLRRFFIY